MLAEAWYIAQRDLKHYLRRRIQFATSLITPVAWLVFFGYAFSGAPLTGSPASVPGVPGLLFLVVFSLPSSPPVKYVLLHVFSVRYIDFFASGVVAASTMFMASFSGSSIVWDKRLGFLNKLLVSPIPRTSIVLGKIISTLIRSLIQGVIMLGLSLLVGVKINTGFYVLLAIPFLLLLITGFSGVSTAVGLRATGHEFFELINLVLMPLFFVSGAIVPLEVMPDWLRVFAQFNPLTYAVDATRKLMLGGELGPLRCGFALVDVLPSLVFDAAVLSLFLVASLLIAALIARKTLI